MPSGGDGEEALARVFRLAEGCDPSSLPLSPAEGFLLSRIDGHTPWRLLREMGGLPPDEAAAAIAVWLDEGLLELVESGSGSDTSASNAGSTSAASPTPSPPVDAVAQSGSGPQIDENLLDDSLEISVDAQRRVLEFECTLSSDYFTILGVDGNADVRTLKKAYFKLSKEFHPDRYFRREIGTYLVRLETIFKKVLEAHELLSDPVARAEIQKSMASGAATPPPAGSPDGPRELSPIERLRQRMPFKIPESVIQERRDRAKEFFVSAKRYDRIGNYLEAASSIRLAIAFDPYNADYKGHFGEIQARAAEMRATQLLEKLEAEGASPSEEGQRKQALRLLEEVLQYRPYDPQINDRIAQLSLDLGDTKAAFEYAERAIEHSPEVAGYRLTMASIYQANGNRGHAVRELEAALELEPGNNEVRNQMALLRGTRRPARGGLV